MSTYEKADTCYVDVDWRLMKGLIPWRETAGDFNKHYFLHHDCKMLSTKGTPMWKTWFDTRGRKENWCSHCDSEPSNSLQGLFEAMEYL